MHTDVSWFLDNKEWSAKRMQCMCGRLSIRVIGIFNRIYNGDIVHRVYIYMELG